MNDILTVPFLLLLRGVHVCIVFLISLRYCTVRVDPNSLVMITSAYKPGIPSLNLQPARCESRISGKGVHGYICVGDSLWLFSLIFLKFPLKMK